MLKKILAVSGKPGLYKLVSRGNRCLIVESVDAAKKRMPIMGTDKVISLNDIAMYTDADDVPLPQILESLKNLQEGKVVEMDYKNASKDELFDLFAKVLPEFDRDRVHASDVKKLIQWYNLLIVNGINEFVEPEETAEAEKEAE
ncbi:MAG: DUF5606 domain-containing protein [Bacteroidaceae bacterium]|nr:DUF5606 domain-containing protein [Bacteroidaceae bacterium]MDO4955784.1 DUF5606 domain-containing protein [Bacteroidales bacterium]